LARLHDKYLTSHRYNTPHFKGDRMSSAKVTWVGGQTYIGTDSTNHSVVLSPPSEGVGMKPSDMLLVALASCTSVDVIGILTKKKMAPVSYEITASGEQDSDPPWTFRKIHLKYTLRGDHLTEKAVEQAIELSEKKYCSVAATIGGVAELSYEYEILPAE
jgi:putative redox protein